MSWKMAAILHVALLLLCSSVESFLIARQCPGGESETGGCLLEAYLTHVPDVAFTASSQHDGNHSPRNSRLFTTALGTFTGAWSSKINDLSQWIQVDLGEEKEVTALATQGRDQVGQWVTSYILRYSTDQSKWTEVQDSGRAFIGNSGSHDVVHHNLSVPFTARYVRLIPITWHGHISLRWQLYGPNCEDCVSTAYINQAKGKGLSSSSDYNELHSYKNARLYHASGCSFTGSWSAKYNDISQWILMDLGKAEEISSIATQGREDYAQWVTAYRIQYSSDSHNWHLYGDDFSRSIFTGNFDRNTVVRHNFEAPITARYYQTWIDMILLK